MINDLLKKIKEAIYGEEVRNSIHDAIEQCYKDATGHPESVAATVKEIGEVSANLSKETADRKAEVNTERKRIDNLIATGTAQTQEIGKKIIQDSSISSSGIVLKGLTHNNYYYKLFEESGSIDSEFCTITNQQGKYTAKLLKPGLYYMNFKVHVEMSGGFSEEVIASLKLFKSNTLDWSTFDVLDAETVEISKTENTSINKKIHFLFKLTEPSYIRIYIDVDTSHTKAITFRIDGCDIIALDWKGKQSANLSELHDLRIGADGVVHNTAGEAVRKQIGNLTEELSNLLEEGTQILDWKNAKVVNGYFTSISDFKSSDVSRTVIIPVDYSKGDTISIHRGIMGERFVYGYTSIEMPKIGDILDYANIQNNAERVILRIKSDTKNILLYYYNSTLDNYDSDDILASIMVQYGKVYTGYEPYGEPRGKKDIINKINGNSEKLISAVYNSPSIFDDVSNPISKGDHFYLYVKDIVGAKYSDIEFYFFRSDNTYKRVIHNINIGKLYAITADEDYTKYRIRIVVESTTSNDMIYAIYNIFQSNGISAINISAKVYDLALDNNKKVEQLTANNLNTCNIFRKVIACGDSYTAGYIVSKTGEIHNVNEEYAWPHYMETITGNTWVNCGHSGTNAYTWQTAERGLPKARAAGKAQAYILGLMINDSSSDSNRNLTLGTITDIGTNNMTFYAQYTKVIKELFNISPNAKVFIETCPKVEGDRYVGYNQAVHDIYDALKSNYPNLHLLDLFKYYNMYTNTSLANDSLAGHYTAIGYQQFAQILSVILSSYINEHISDFQDVAFIEYDN